MTNNNPVISCLKVLNNKMTKHNMTLFNHLSKIVDKSKKLNTAMTTSIKIYPENIHILKKPVGRTHNCSNMYMGKKVKKKDKKKQKKQIKVKKIKKEIKKTKILKKYSKQSKYKKKQIKKEKNKKTIKNDKKLKKKEKKK